LKELAEKTINQRIAITGVQPKLSVAPEDVDGNTQDTRLAIVGLWGEYSQTITSAIPYDAWDRRFNHASCFSF
jgi:hypothetical protein